MLALDDSRWSDLQHAYGPAGDIPGLLSKGAQDFRPGHLEESAWFDLWSALCHQGDVYTSSYAALPHLVAMVPEHLQRRHWEPLFLAACIELARLEGKGPTVPEDLAAAYRDAVTAGHKIAREYVPSAWDADSSLAIRASLAAFGGDLGAANSLLDAEGV